MTDRISRADIVNVALGLLARGGLHSLVMRRIATELGIQQSALYWHFENKQQLLGAVADEIVATVEANGTTWSDRVGSLAGRLRAELLRYPDGAELVATAVAFRLGGDEVARRFTTELADAGLSDDDAAVATAALVHFVFGSVTDEQQHHQAAALGAIAGSSATGRAADDHFGRGVDLIIAGIAARLAPTGP